MSVGKRIQLLRGELSRKAFAERIQIVENTLRNYEADLSLPNIDVASRICREFGATLEWLIEGVGSPEGTPQSNPISTAHSPAPLTCHRCLRLEKKLEAVEGERRQASEKLVETLQSNVALVTELGQLKLENMKLTLQLEAARHVCSGHSSTAKNMNNQEILFDEQQNIPSSEVLPQR